MARGNWKKSRSSISAARRSIGTDLKGPIQRSIAHIHPITYYAKLSDDEVDVRDSQDSAISRLTILEMIDSACPANSDNFTWLRSLVKENFDHHLVDHGLRLDKGSISDLYEISARDRISHFILKLALGVSRLDLRTWFVTQEKRLFFYRIWSMTQRLETTTDQASINPIIKDNSIGKIWTALERGCDDDPIEFQEIDIQNVDESIVQCLFQQGRLNRHAKAIHSEFWSLKNETMNKFHMKSVFRLSAHCPESAWFIRHRLAYMTKGYVYISRLHLPMLLLDRFNHYLNKSLDKYTSLNGRSKIEDAMKHPQLGVFLQQLPNAMSINQVEEMDVARKDSKEPAAVSAALLPNLSRHLPFCARRMLDGLNKQRHLKHFARLQLSLFLKDIKMPVDEQISYWGKRWEDPQKFEREHVYTIRYQYGLEGKRLERSMYGCRTMISNAFPVATSGDVHGCPYRELKGPKLRSMLTAYGVTKNEDLEDIASLAKNHEYQRACQQTFIALHPGHDGAGVGNHPIQYYRESCNYCAAKSGGVIGQQT